MSDVADSSNHHGSHRRLLHTAAPGSGTPSGRVDAIIVPTIRPPAYLQDAVRLAVRLGVPLITLHSGRYTTAASARKRFSQFEHIPGLDRLNLIAIDLPAAHELLLPDMATSALLRGTRFQRTSDISAKRNLALKLCHLVGWERVAFLDDDIIIPDPADLSRAAALLNLHNAVGLQIDGFPDNSVVCHAYRMADGNQQTFIGGGAIVIETSRNRSFFPDIYNEDWFYLLDTKGYLQSVATLGRALQRSYDPFRTPDRARAEEFGDVLAEGIFWLLDNDRPITEGNAEHWEDFLQRRRRFITHVMNLITRTRAATADTDRIVEALKAARGRCELITPQLCDRYIGAWIEDRVRWERHLDKQYRRYSLDVALKQIERFSVPNQR